MVQLYWVLGMFRLSRKVDKTIPTRHDTAPAYHGTNPDQTSTIIARAHIASRTHRTRTHFDRGRTESRTAKLDGDEGGSEGGTVVMEAATEAVTPTAAAEAVAMAAVKATAAKGQRRG